MTRNQNKEELSVSLFPMFNILTCTLGVLIFIMGTVTVVSLGRGKSLKIVPEELRGEHEKLPHYFVWDGEYLILLDKNDTISFDRDLSEFKTFKSSHEYIAEKLKGSTCGDVFENVKKNSKTEYIVLFVRERGFDSFMDLKNFIKKEGIDIGYEPMDNYSKIKL